MTQRNSRLARRTRELNWKIRTMKGALAILRNIARDVLVSQTVGEAVMQRLDDVEHYLNLGIKNERARAKGDAAFEKTQANKS